MATETGTVELPSQTTNEVTEPTEAETQAAIEALLRDDPQKSDEPAPTEPVPSEEPPQEPQPTEPQEPEAPAAAEDEDTDTEALPDDVQARIDKRIGKEVAKRKELEEQLAAREAKLAETEAKIKELSETTPQQPPSATPGPDDPILKVPDVKAHWDEEQKAVSAINRANDMLRNLRREPEAALDEFRKLTNLNYSVEDAKDWLEQVKEGAQTKRMLHAQQRGIATERHVAKLEKEAERYHAEATKAYPDALNKKSAFGQRVEQLSKRFTGLLNPRIAPDGMLILLDLAAAQLAREAKATATPVATPKPPKLQTVTKAPVQARTTNGTTKTSSALKKAAIESGDVREIASYLATTRTLALQ